MISTVIALPYEIARLPLAIIEDKLGDRLPETSMPRVTLNRVIGSADKLAGTVLSNSEIAGRGVDRLERFEKLLAAARLEREAATDREQAREAAEEGRREAAEKREAAQERAASGLDEADEAEARGKQEAQEHAEKAAAEKKAAADERAASRAAAVEERKEQVDSAAEAKKKAAQNDAQVELKEARETTQSAAENRADAERLSELTETKKQERKQS